MSFWAKVFLKLLLNSTYFRNESGWETDFVVWEEGKARKLYQVCFEASDYETWRREVRGLLTGAKSLGCRDLVMVGVGEKTSLGLPEGIEWVDAEEFLKKR